MRSRHTPKPAPIDPKAIAAMDYCQLKDYHFNRSYLTANHKWARRRRETSASEDYQSPFFHSVMIQVAEEIARACPQRRKDMSRIIQGKDIDTLKIARYRGS